MVRLRVAVLALFIATAAVADDQPREALERALGDLEATVRAIHEERLDARRETERAHATVAQLEAETRDLEREAAAIEDEVQPLAAQVAALEREREAARSRRARLETDRAGLENALGGARGGAGAAFADRVKTLEARIEKARACSVEPDGTVRLGNAATLAPGSPLARELADQIERRSAPALVRVRLEVPHEAVK